MSLPISSTAQSLSPLLTKWATNQPPSSAQKQQIVRWEVQHLNSVWGLSPQMAESRALEVIEKRALLLQAVVRRWEKAADEDSGLLPVGRQWRSQWSEWIVPLWTLWLPLAQQLDHQQRRLEHPLIQGILGGQGTGKTTLSKLLRFVLAELGHETVALSLDDLYLTYAARQELRQQDARLIWRGPPGTHDIDLGLETLRALRSAGRGEQVSIPQFDKSLHDGQGDRVASIICDAPTIVLFEGWCVGAQPLASSVFDCDVVCNDLPDPIVTAADRQFAKDCNQRLKQYVPLWDFLDALVVLSPRDYRLSMQWRQAAEREIRATGKGGMSDGAIAEFVTYFWKALHPQLFITPLTHSSSADLVVYIELDHTVGELRSPAVWAS